MLAPERRQQPGAEERATCRSPMPRPGRGSVASASRADELGDEALAAEEERRVRDLEGRETLVRAHRRVESRRRRGGRPRQDELGGLHEDGALELLQLDAGLEPELLVKSARGGDRRRGPRPAARSGRAPA